MLFFHFSPAMSNWKSAATWNIRSYGRTLPQEFRCRKHGWKITQTFAQDILRLLPIRASDFFRPSDFIALFNDRNRSAGLRTRREGKAKISRD